MPQVRKHRQVAYLFVQEREEERRQQALGSMERDENIKRIVTIYNNFSLNEFNEQNFGIGKQILQLFLRGNRGNL